MTSNEKLALIESISSSMV
jgi:nucleolar complex protein 3